MRTLRLSRPAPLRHAQRGLTLLEIMIVIAILGLLMVVIVPRVMGSKDSADASTTYMQVKNWKKDIDMWALTTKSDKACSEISLTEVAKYNSKGESSAAEQKDAWNKPVQIMCGDAGVRGVYSFGPNKVDDKGEGDDIASWKDLKTP